MNNDDNIKKLNELFGSYRAEWLKDRIFHLFVRPCYFPGLEDCRPCVLQGGRGSGKTTVLRGLSYQGQFAFHESNIEDFDQKVSYIGIYHRVDTNHVRAFLGGGLKTEEWTKIFAHYFNLVICREILIFLKWHRELSGKVSELSKEEYLLIKKSLHIQNKCNDFDNLLSAVDHTMYEFQSCINNITDSKERLCLSFAGDPIRLITEYICRLPQFKGKVFYLLLDEYENFIDYQQIVVNSLLKHNTENYTFKIGVRELGWRVKHTLNSQELLHDPADYILFKIEDKLINEGHFEAFAKEVCQQRIRELLPDEDNKKHYDIETHLCSLSPEEEATLLDVSQSEYVKSIKKLSPNIQEKLSNLPDLYLFFIGYWAYWHNNSLEFTIADYEHNMNSWNTRYGNYKYEMLFKIKKGRGRSGIQKYYAGWDTFIKLSAGNIRYLMELVYRSYEKHLNSGADILSKVKCETQTEAAQNIGKKNIMQLESLWKEGARLTKLLLSIGRVFNVLAREEGNHAAEINQFTIENSREMSPECNELISAAVMNIALIRETGTKLGETETKDYTYSIHPIFAPFFVFSYRKKRKIVLKEDDILGLINNPKKLIHDILKARHIDDNAVLDEKSEQLDLFDGEW